MTDGPRPRLWGIRAYAFGGDENEMPRPAGRGVLNCESRRRLLRLAHVVFLHVVLLGGVLLAGLALLGLLLGLVALVGLLVHCFIAAASILGEREGRHREGEGNREQ